MPATFLTWNPANFEISEEGWAAEGKRIRAGKTVLGAWWVARVKNIPQRRRVFLVRQCTGPRGIIASGTTTAEPFEDEKYDGDGSGNYVEVAWDAQVRDLSGPLPIQDLLGAVPQVPWNTMLGSGTSTLDEQAVGKIEQLWAQHLRHEARVR
ncbi:hypothetical protein [Promicromonospora soli]